ncbi:cyclic nucleotide-binding domain containing protein [Stylonychia lemnae]|uniref:Cyclic nucleotide-binding domain containing protein n=1 Tax=Stylonychia lemnae TaxID=5949 RepID=A0A078A2I7_STYLE|nr:cyclic nucleotide-binding domain containing protein [Stylonychia lemnae]|eukprot:CDW76421.1 cyclic nucleotide-binding domain containing protein [Stylonychia lemnae]
MEKIKLNTTRSQLKSQQDYYQADKTFDDNHNSSKFELAIDKLRHPRRKLTDFSYDPNLSSSKFTFQSIVPQSQKSILNESSSNHSEIYSQQTSRNKAVLPPILDKLNKAEKENLSIMSKSRENFAHSKQPSQIVTLKEKIQKIQRKRSKIQREPSRLLDDIYSKNPLQAKESDHKIVAEYLMKHVQFFQNMEKSLIRQLAGKLEQRIYEKDEKIIIKGEEAHEMFILYSGDVGIYLDQECQKCVATLQSDKVFGEAALEKNDKRGATVIAHSVVKVLVLRKIFYRNIVQNQKQLEKFKNLEFLQTIQPFKDWNLIKVQELNNKLNTLALKPGDNLFQQGDQAEVLYIVKDGILNISSNIGIIQYKSHPKSLQEWEVNKIQRNVNCFIKKAQPGDLLGLNELMSQIQLRESSALCEIDSEILYINKDDFLKIIEKREIQDIEDKSLLMKIDPVKLAKEYMNQLAADKMKKDIMIGAVKLNDQSNNNRKLLGSISNRANLSQERQILEKEKIIKRTRQSNFKLIASKKQVLLIDQNQYKDFQNIKESPLDKRVKLLHLIESLRDKLFD